MTAWFDNWFIWIGLAVLGWVVYELIVAEWIDRHRGGRL